MAARIHDIAGLVLAALFLFFVVANVVTANWWQYVPKPGGFVERCKNQLVFYCWGIFHDAPHPYPPTTEDNFNSLQQIIYWLVMYLLVPTLIMTGLIFLWPDFAPKRVFGMDGLLPVALIVSFMIAHIYLGTTGTKVTSLFRMMITGWHEE